MYAKCIPNLSSNVCQIYAKFMFNLFQIYVQLIPNLCQMYLAKFDAKLPIYQAKLPIYQVYSKFDSEAYIKCMPI